MCDCAVFLSRLEFSILLMAGGIEEIPCFALPEAGNVDRRQMTKSIHGLVLKGFLQMTEAGLRMSPGLAQMIEGIRVSREYLFVEPGDDYRPQRIAYIGPKAVILENAAHADYDFRLFLKETKDFWMWIEEAFDMPSTDIVSKTEAMELTGLSELAEREREMFQELGHLGGVWGIRFWMERLKSGLGDSALVGMRLVYRSDKPGFWDLVLFPGRMNLWFLRGNDHSLEVIPDSMETRDEMKELFWRGTE